MCGRRVRCCRRVEFPWRQRGRRMIQQVSFQVREADFFLPISPSSPLLSARFTFHRLLLLLFICTRCTKCPECRETSYCVVVQGMRWCFALYLCHKWSILGVSISSFKWIKAAAAEPLRQVWRCFCCLKPWQRPLTPIPAFQSRGSVFWGPESPACFNVRTETLSFWN